MSPYWINPCHLKQKIEVNTRYNRPSFFIFQVQRKQQKLMPSNNYKNFKVAPKVN